MEGNTNQYWDGRNGTVDQGDYDGKLSHIHHTIFKTMEPNYRKFRGTIHLKHLMEACGLSHSIGALPWLKHNWRNNKIMICWHNILGCCKNLRCTYYHVPNQKNLDNEWINSVCDVFRETDKWITNYDTPFPGAMTGGNGGPRGGNSENSGNGGVCGSMNATEAKTTKMKILDK